MTASFQEALLCVSELKGQKHMNVFVEQCIAHVLERSEPARKHTAFLLRDSIKQNFIQHEAWLAGSVAHLDYSKSLQPL